MNDIERTIHRIQIKAFEGNLELEQIAISALEKQIPKKPTDSINGSGLYCSACKKVWVNINNNYCHRCGQAIDWSDADEC
jgi:rRNA maturation endonuclease Nob1